MITSMTRSLGDPILELRAKLGKCFGQDVRFVTEQIDAQFIELEVCLYHIEQCELRGRIIEMKPWVTTPHE